jgi:hypothetical protein
MQQNDKKLFVVPAPGCRWTSPAKLNENRYNKQALIKQALYSKGKLQQEIFAITSYRKFTTLDTECVLM